MINNSTIKELVAYFEAKENLTQEEKRLLGEIKPYTDTFIVTCVTREDLEDRGFDASEVSDYKMERIADRMGDSLCDTGAYWDALDCWAEDYAPRKNED